MILEKNYRSQIPPLTSPIEGLACPYKAVLEGLSIGFVPPPPLDFTEWATKNVNFGNDSELSGAYNPDNFPFYREILDCLRPEHPARTVCVMKSAQIGGTVLAQIFVGGCLALDPSPFMYFHPSLDNGKRWVRTKWSPFVRNCRSLRDVFQTDSSRAAANNIFYKERKDHRGWLQVGGANSAASLSMISTPRQVQDDLSKWEDNEAGDSESQADSRSNAFPYAKIFKLSTPMIKDTCKISKVFERSDQRYWMVPCPHCGEKLALTWDNLKQSIKPDMEDTSKVHFTCDVNGCVIEHHHKRKMVAAGEWVARKPKSNIPGFFIWSAYSPLITWAAIADKYLSVIGDPGAEQNFYNDWLGLPYEQKGEAPPWETIRDRANEITGYPRQHIPPNALLITIGADCQADRVEWHVKGYGENLQRFTIDYGVIDGHISTDQTQAALDALLKRKYKNAYGREIGIDMLAIDANYDTDTVLDWTRKHPENRVIAVRGAKGEHAPPLVPVMWERKKGVKVKKRQKRFFNVGQSSLKTALFKHLEKETIAERGYCGYPQDMDDEFFRQLCSEKRVVKTDKRTHYAVMEWQRLPKTRNEVLDTEIYAEAAARRLGWVELTAEQWQKLRTERESDPGELQLDMLDANMAGHKPIVVKPVEPNDDDTDTPAAKAKAAKKKLARSIPR